MMEVFRNLAGIHTRKVTMPCGDTLRISLHTNDVSNNAHVASGTNCKEKMIYHYGETDGEAVEEFVRGVKRICADCSRIQTKGK